MVKIKYDMILSKSDFKIFPKRNGEFHGMCIPGDGHYYTLENMPKDMAHAFLASSYDDALLRRLYKYFRAHGFRHSDLDGKFQEPED